MKVPGGQPDEDSTKLSASDPINEDSKPLSSEPQSSLSSTSTIEGDVGMTTPANVTATTLDMMGTPVNSIDEGRITLASDAGAQATFVIRKSHRTVTTKVLTELQAAGYTDHSLHLYEAKNLDTEDIAMIKKTGNRTYELTYDDGVSSIPMRAYGNTVLSQGTKTGTAIRATPKADPETPDDYSKTLNYIDK